MPQSFLPRQFLPSFKIFQSPYYRLEQEPHSAALSLNAYRDDVGSDEPVTTEHQPFIAPSTYPPLHYASAQISEEELGQLPLYQTPTKRRQIILASGLGLSLLMVLVLLLATRRSLPPSIPSSPIDALFARQSSSLQQARARYSLRTGRSPPEHYDDFYKFARQHHCLIDEYSQVDHDFEPFYEITEKNASFFRQRLDFAWEKAVKDGGPSFKPLEIKDGHYRSGDDRWALYSGDWQNILERLTLPDMRILLTPQDEPRIAFNVREPGALARALNTSDPTPFENKPHPTSKYYGLDGEKKCLHPNRAIGFGELTNDENAFFLASASTQITTDLYPILSMTHIDPCFADIRVPSAFYYDESQWSPKYSHPDNIAWADKREVLWWRGATSGGIISGQNYHHFPRFRLIDIGRNHSGLMDVVLTGINDVNCHGGDEDPCDRDAITKEYDIGGHRGTAREDGYGYKYVMDIDGNSFSGRYLGLMKSGSLVFKSTIFDEYFSTWLEPFVHYIPVLPDLSDLVSKIEWAIAHDDEARKIQQAGKMMAEQVLTDRQNDCYYYAVLLEYARLQKMGQ